MLCVHLMVCQCVRVRETGAKLEEAFIDPRAVKNFLRVGHYNIFSLLEGCSDLTILKLSKILYRLAFVKRKFTFYYTRVAKCRFFHFCFLGRLGEGLVVQVK